MKKMMTFLTIALTTLVAFVSCANPTYSEGWIDLSDKVIFEKDKDNEYETKGWSYYFDFKEEAGVEEVSIAGYKYLKVEVATDDKSGYQLAVQFMNGNNKCALLQTTEMKSEYKEFYIPCGTNWMIDTNYDGTGDTQCTETVMKAFQVYAQDPNAGYSTVDGVKIKIKKITLTCTNPDEENEE